MGSGSMSLKDKWVKTKWLMADPKLRRFVPETKRFTRSALDRMIARYKMIYFKPADGTGGGGIARVERIVGRSYKVKMKRHSSRVSSIRALYRRLSAKAKRRNYLLQKGIYLQHSNGRPFDIRVMMQKSKRGIWVPTGTFVKLGRPNAVATNYHQGGALKLLGPTLRRAGYKTSQIAGYRSRLNRLGILTARCFTRHRARFKELGLDVALDRHGRLWILEVNTRPNISALKTLKDKSLYRTIMRYGKQYGRSK
jgi:hypothetical protein